MNKTYYKGNITLLSGLEPCKRYYLSELVDNFIKRGVSKEDIKKIYRLFSGKVNNNINIFDITGMFPKLSALCNLKDFYFQYNLKENIIFEKILDESGAYYGKELYTGLIFPILDDIHNKNVVIIKEEVEKTANLITYCLTLNINFKKMDKCEAIIYNYKVADINEINEYLEVKKHKRKLKKETNKIIELANKNVYNTEIVPAHKEEVKREKQDELTIMMENIEFLLEKLGTINPELKEKYEKEYELLLNSEDEILSTSSLTKASLSRIEGEMEYAISYSRSSSSDIVSYLENLKKEYLNNFISNIENKTNITLKEIDKLNELFLKMKSSYNLKVQREVIRNISFIYLMEVYENIGIISKEDLEDSYFIDNKKSIIIAIETLIRLDLIEDNIIIDYNSDLNIEEILDLISKIKFKQSTENKGITKKLEI